MFVSVWSLLHLRDNQVPHWGQLRLSLKLKWGLLFRLTQVKRQFGCAGEKKVKMIYTYLMKQICQIYWNKPGVPGYLLVYNHAHVQSRPSHLGGTFLIVIYKGRLAGCSWVVCVELSLQICVFKSCGFEGDSVVAA